MPERPLLILPTPAEPEKRGNRPGGRGRRHLPTRERQAQRLGPRFSVLQRALDARRARLRTEAVGLVPEEVIVLETVGSVENFVNAVRRVDGLEWLGEIEVENIPPDDDFYVPDAQDAPRPDKVLRGRLFLVFSNHQALQQLLSLWGLWTSEEQLGWGRSTWGQVFSQLRDVRPWGLKDRLIDTGVLDDWQERIEHEEEVVPCEIELWFRNEEDRRLAARERVASLVQGLQGEIVSEAVIQDIAYHALLARLPVAQVRALLGQSGDDMALVQCENIQYFRAAGQVAGILAEGKRSTDHGAVEEPSLPLGEPVVALLDGLPLQGHRRLAGRLVVDDPDNYEAYYLASERRHGTAMASLILQGDLDSSEPALNRRLYVRPVLRPDLRDWRSPRVEVVPENTLVVDVIHRAVRRLFEGERNEPPVAPHICVINLSIGIRDRLFDGALSPLARLLDWLAWKYQVLFIVSAGNHARSIELGVPASQVSAQSPQEIQTLVIQAVALDSRNRRLLSPAEAVNALTVGAVHEDASSPGAIQRAVQPYVDDGLPSVVNAQGMGYRRAIKPEVLLPGGRVVLLETYQGGQNAVLEIYDGTRAPGQCVAAPGPSPGDVSYTRYSRGTSNATALASRAASRLYDVLYELQNEPGGDLIEVVPYAVWLKALLVHGANWGSGGEVLDGILRTSQNTRQFKEYITRFLGYGVVDLARVSECSEYRVTALGGGMLASDCKHVHRFPLPPSLSGKRHWRRLAITLAWLTPVHMKHQGWRRAHLWFEPPLRSLQVARQQAHWQAVQRGTVQHEVMEGERAAAFVDGDSLEIQVNCRADAGVLEEQIPYALATTLEVAEETGVDIYNEVSLRIHAARVEIAPSG